MQSSDCGILQGREETEANVFGVAVHCLIGFFLEQFSNQFGATALLLEDTLQGAIPTLVLLDRAIVPC
jgi:hypothetical protein